MPTTTQLITREEIRAAQARIAAICARTPLVKLEAAIDGCELYVKAENLQPIGSFKLRGATNKIIQLTTDQRQRPRPGSSLRRARSWIEGGHRDAVQRA